MHRPTRSTARVDAIALAGEVVRSIEVEPTCSGARSRPDPQRVAAKHASRSALAVVATLVATGALVPVARADAIGVPTQRTDCPVGARSALAGDGHSMTTYCAPNLAFGDWPCVDGRRLDVVGLHISSRRVSPEWDGRRGPMPPELADQIRELAVADGPCTADAAAPIVELPAEIALRPEREGSLEGPPSSLVPPGCQRVRVWISDPAFACPRPEPVDPRVVSSPAASPSPPPRSNGCACATVAPRPASSLGAGWIALLLLVVRVAAGRKRKDLRAPAWMSMLLVALAPSLARADAISPTPACPPGQSRGAGPLTDLGFYGHGGAPPCQPAVCSDVVACPRSHVCRRDTHCLIERTTRELRESHGHGQRFDPADPASWEDVRRSYDLGACDEGQCPSGSRCLVVSTCRAHGERDTAVLATDISGGAPAADAWVSGVPYTDGATPAPEPPVTTGTLEAPPTTGTLALPPATGTLEAPPTTGTLAPPPATGTLEQTASTPTPVPVSTPPPVSGSSSSLCSTSARRRGTPVPALLLVSLVLALTGARRH
jgi:hypothetical protein